MSKFAAFLDSNSAPILGASVFVVGTIGAGAYFGVLSPQDTPAFAPQEVVQTAEERLSAKVVVAAGEPETTPKPILEAELEAGTSKEPEVIAAVPRAPSIDEVRSEADGLTVLAGRGEPGGEVTLFVDDAENATVQVGTDGAFAIVAFLDPSPDAKVLSLVQNVDDVELATADIILAPQPVAQAAVIPKPAPETATIAPQEAVVESLETSDQIAAEANPTPQAKVATIAVVDPVPVQPKTEVVVLKSDEEGVEIINRSSAPDVMSNVEIDTIGYSEAGDVQLSGRAQSVAASVRVYLDNAVVATLDVDASGRWRGNLPDVDTGVYTLRVDEVDSGGAITSRVETPFKRESSEVLAAAGGTDNAPAKAITVQTGATLWAIARDRYGDGTLFVRVFEANTGAIKDPNLIYPGQVFELPE